MSEQLLYYGLCFDTTYRNAGGGLQMGLIIAVRRIANRLVPRTERAVRDPYLSLAALPGGRSVLAWMHVVLQLLHIANKKKFSPEVKSL